VKIFVSYRRDDTQQVVSRLCGRLDEAFGARNVFYDERSIGTGTDFLGAVGGAIYTSDAILVVIGRNWTTCCDVSGQRRLNDPDDPVGWEVGLALASGRLLIPLLVDGASKWNIDLEKSVMVGDRWRDVEAGRRAGCAVVLIKRDYAERSALPDADLVVADLHEAVPWILKTTKREKDS